MGTQAIWKNQADIGKYYDSYAREKRVEVIAGECCPDHIHLLVSIPPHLSISQFMGYLKSKSSLMIFDKHANLKYKYETGISGAGILCGQCKGNMGQSKEYIRTQLQEDMMMDTLEFKEEKDPFTGR